MYKTPLLFVCFAFWALSVAAQEESKSTFSVRTGYQHVRTLDLNASPLLYASNNGMLGCRYEKWSASGFWKADLSVSLGSNQSKQHGVRNAAYPNKPDIFGKSDTTYYELNPGLSFISWSLDISRYWKLNARNAFLGLGISNDHSYGAIGADTWFFEHLDLRPCIRRHFSLGAASRVVIELSTTLLSYIVRQPYTLDPSLPINNYLVANIRTGSSLATINSFQHLDLSSALTKSIGNGRELGLEYQFTWLNHKRLENRNLGMYSNSLAFCYNF